MRSVKSLVGDEDGTELAEFALTAGVFFLVFFGIIEFCMVIFTGGFVAYAAQQGTRYAMVRGSDWTNSCASTSSLACYATPGNVQNYILGLPHPGINLQASNITVTPINKTVSGGQCTANGKGCQIKVQVSYAFGMNIPFFPNSIPLSSTSIETIQK